MNYYRAYQLIIFLISCVYVHDALIIIWYMSSLDLFHAFNIY